jgi:hypothetical protein
MASGGQHLAHSPHPMQVLKRNTGLGFKSISAIFLIGLGAFLKNSGLPI